MKIKKLLISTVAIGLIASSLSLGACSCGSSSPINPTVPQPHDVAESPPSGFILPKGANISAADSIYILSAGGILNTLALPEGVLKPALQINAPSIASGSFTSAFVQLFNPGSPIVIVTSGTPSSTVVNIASSADLVNVQDAGIKAEALPGSNVIWAQYLFNGVNSTSTPIAAFANNAAYIGTDIAADSFLAIQSSTTATNATPVAGASPGECSSNTHSTAATAIANTTLTGGNFIGIGTNFGEVLIYGVTGQHANLCENLTKAAKAQAIYTLGSGINVLSFTTTAQNNYGYFETLNGQIWRIIANTDNIPQSFVQLNVAGGAFSGAVPPTGLNQLSALYSDSNNNVYAGSQTGVIYFLAATNSTGNVNTIWTSTTIAGNPRVLSISSTTNGSIIAITSLGIYNIVTF